MTFRWVLLGLAVAVGCGTTPNPRSCLDGICNDQQFPFCDVDGTLGGEPKECIAVTCTAGEVVACRGDVAVTCNATGNDYAFVDCDGQCDVPAGGCVSCLADPDCSGATPICELATHTCRGCTLDTDCASGVCNATSGACLSSTEVVYAAPSGIGQAPCSMADPCPVDRAITTALAASVPPPVRLQPGTYTAAILVASAKPLVIVATDAVLDTTANPSLGADNGAMLEIRGLRILDHGSVVCGFPSLIASALTLRRVTYAAQGGFIDASRCDLRIVDSDLRADSSTSQIMRIETNSTLDADRTRFVADGTILYVLINGLGQNLRIRITNSLLDGVAVAVNASDPVGGSTQSRFELGSSTFVNSGIGCPNTNVTVRAENNILRWTTGTPTDLVAFGPRCTYANNIFFPGVAQGGTNRDVDPKFVNLAQRDYQLAADSPAIDTAIPTTLFPATPDLLGVSRPQGAQPDVGAFERKP